jgi:hypothetical protein
MGDARVGVIEIIDYASEQQKPVMRYVPFFLEAKP